MAGWLFDKEPLPLMLFSFLLGSEYCILAHTLTHKLCSFTLSLLLGLLNWNTIKVFKYTHT